MSDGGSGGPGADDGLDGSGGARSDREGQAGRSGWTGGRRLARIVAGADVVAIAVALTVIATTVVAGQPIGGVDWLLGPGIALAVVGLVCLCGIGWARRQGTGRRSSADVAPQRSLGQRPGRSPGPVDRRASWAAGALGVIGALSAFTVLIFTHDGTPAGAGGGCLYRLSSHGIFTCVSESTYRLAGAAEQREVVGILLFFYAMYLYAAIASGTVSVGGRSAASRAGDLR
jgi:hypothetical protein